MDVQQEIEKLKQEIVSRNGIIDEKAQEHIWSCLARGVQIGLRYANQEYARALKIVLPR